MPSVKEQIESVIRSSGANHGDGMPGEVETQVVPEYSFGDGASTVLVTATWAQQWFLPCPYNFSTWRPRGAKLYYSNPEELVGAMSKLCRKPKGCWIEAR